MVRTHGNMLVDGKVTIFGGGGITREVIRLLQGGTAKSPWCDDRVNRWPVPSVW